MVAHSASEEMTTEHVLCFYEMCIYKQQMFVYAHEEPWYIQPLTIRSTAMIGGDSLTALLIVLALILLGLVALLLRAVHTAQRQFDEQRARQRRRGRSWRERAESATCVEQTEPDA
jgi:hypothetical protein